jgi:hypothetical protein
MIAALCHHAVFGLAAGAGYASVVVTDVLALLR